MCILEFIGSFFGEVLRTVGFKPSEFREEAEQDDKEDVGEVKSDKLNKIKKLKNCVLCGFLF